MKAGCRYEHEEHWLPGRHSCLMGKRQYSQEQLFSCARVEIIVDLMIKAMLLSVSLPQPSGKVAKRNSTPAERFTWAVL